MGGGVVVDVELVGFGAGDDDVVGAVVVGVVEVAFAGAGAGGVLDLLEVEVVLGEGGGGLLEEGVGGDVFEIVVGVHGWVGFDEEGGWEGEERFKFQEAAVFGGGVGEVFEALAVEFVD